MQQLIIHEQQKVEKNQSFDQWENTYNFVRSSNFGDRLAEKLGSDDRSGAWLARQVGVHPSTVSKWLNNESRPVDPQVVRKIAETLNIDEDINNKASTGVNQDCLRNIWNTMPIMEKRNIPLSKKANISIPIPDTQVEIRTGETSASAQLSDITLSGTLSILDSQKHSNYGVRLLSHLHNETTIPRTTTVAAVNSANLMQQQMTEMQRRMEEMQKKIESLTNEVNTLRQQNNPSVISMPSLWDNSRI